MRKHFGYRFLVMGAVAALVMPVMGEPDRSDRDWRGIDELYPADGLGGAACGQRMGCYKKGCWGCGFNRCMRCCAACPGNNCERGCFAHFVHPSLWP